MRPPTNIQLHYLFSPPTPEGFALLAKEALAKMLARQGVSSAVRVHLGQGDVDPGNPEFLEALRVDYEKHGKALFTATWGEGKDDWETIILVASVDHGRSVLLALWVGQFAHDKIVEAAEKLRTSPWDGRSETVPAVLGFPPRTTD